MKRLLLVLFMIVVTLPLSAQQITNVQQKVENGRIVITYDLEGSDECGYTVLVTAKDSYGNSITPLVVVGDIGEVDSGRNRTIYWEPLLEGENVDGWRILLKLIPKGFIFVQGGTFQMGSNDRDSDENPVHTVTVNDFYIGKYEVTQKEWKEVMGNNPSHWKGDNLPVENVSWYEVVEFCNKKSIKEGLTPCYSGTGKNITCDFGANGYRLPTEAEWEYAARGGNKSKGYKYSGSNTIGDFAWYDDNSEDKTHPVGKKQSNELGIYDMSGNVWEWCNDWYDSDYYSSSPRNDPKGPFSGSYRVLRGGSWYNYANNLLSWSRFNYGPYNSNYYIGFRLLRTP